MGGSGANLDARAAKKKKVSAKTLTRYRFAAAAADKKLAAAELAVASTPSVENQQVLEQAQAAASAAHRKLEGAAAPVGGNSSQQRRVDQALRANQARTDGSVKKVNPSPCVPTPYAIARPFFFRIAVSPFLEPLITPHTRVVSKVPVRQFIPQARILAKPVYS